MWHLVVTQARLGTTRRARAATRVAVAGVALATAAGVLVGGQAASQAASPPPNNTGFTLPFAGARRYLNLAPTQVMQRSQLNRPIGRRKADEIARRFGLRRSDAFTKRQYKLFVSGKGVGGDPAAAKLVDQSVRILTNTVGRPLYSKIGGRWVPSVLASYGVMVNRDGLLESPANTDAPTRQVNSVLVPGGYLGTWCRANGATKSLRRLYRSGYLVEAIYGNRSQQISGVAQLVPNNKLGVRGDMPSARTIVGMSMAPSIWLVNFALIYTLNPAMAAKMPSAWAPIPPSVARAILASPTGQVPYSRYAAAFR